MTFRNRGWATVLLLIALFAGAGWAFATFATGARQPIRVGILHSQTGPLAASERAVIDATVLALEQINQEGGLLGRRLTWVIADGASDERVFAREAERLIRQEQVAVLFGCWTSASRKAVKPIVERERSLLFYPVQYEGCELSQNIVYTGAAPNQQIVPAVVWATEELGKRAFVVGSDYIFPRVAGEIIRRQLTALDGQLVGEAYVPLGSRDVREAAEAIRSLRPDFILNTINGETNLAFFRALQDPSASGPRIPVISFSIGENELTQIDNMAALEGHYAVWNYFQSIPRPANRAFVDAFQRRFGPDRVVSDPMQAAYCGVRLWAQAVVEAGTEVAQEVRDSLPNQSLNGPEGVLTIDPATQHLWKTVRVGRIQQNGQFEIVWDSKHPIRPLPYPISQTPAGWDRFIQDLFEGWGGRWSRPADSATRPPIDAHLRILP